MIRSSLWLPVLVGLTATLGGCQSYHRRPLDLGTYAAAWAARDIDIEPIAEYARRLAGADERPAAFDSSDGLTLAEAKAIALHLNPTLRLARLQAQVPLVGAQEAGWWDDPQLEVEVLRIANRGQGKRWKLEPPTIEGLSTANGIEVGRPTLARLKGDRVERPWIIGAGLSLTIPLSGRLAIEKKRAWAEYDAAWRQILVQEWQVVGSLQARWLEWSAVQERIALTQHYLERLERVMSVAEKLAETGELKPSDARVFRIEHASREVGLRALEAQAAEQRLALLAVLGLVPEAPFALTPQLTARGPDIPPEQRRERLLEHSPRLLLAQAAYEVAEQQLHLEIRKQFPDVTIGPGYGFEEGQSRLGFGLGLPIPLWNRNRQAVAVAAATRDAARARAEAEYEAAISELARAEARLAAAEERRELVEQVVVPLVDRQIEETQALIALGEVDVLLLRDALQDALQTRLQLVDTTLTVAQAASELRSMLQPYEVTPAARGKDER